MSRIQELTSLNEAKRIFFTENFAFQPHGERISLHESLKRVLGQDVVSPMDLPSFSRSSMDGYAVKAGDTIEATRDHPVTLRLVGEVSMGSQQSFSLCHGEAALIHTGGMIPAGGDAVVILENTNRHKTGLVEIYQPVNFGENVLIKGEDVKTGDLLLKKGTRIHVEDIAGCLAIGMTDLEVYRQPRIAVLSSGDEVVPPGKDLQTGQVYDINTGALCALIRSQGGVPIPYPLIRDNASELEKVASDAIREADAVVFTAGSSASDRDVTASVIGRLGKPGVLVHGIAVRPGKPTILARCAEKPVIGLPGNPVSALVIARLFLKPLIHDMTGLCQPQIEPVLSGRLVRSVSSDPAKDEFFPVKVSKQNGEYQIEPINFKSNFIFNLTRSDGLMQVPAGDADRFAGSYVQVMLFRS